MLIDPPTIYTPVERMRQRDWWQAWLKPYFVFHAPFDRVIWIDADCFVLQDIDALFAKLNEGPILYNDSTPVEVENDPRLYSLIPLSSGKQVNGARLNSGVVGLCKSRDYALLATWCYAVLWAARQPQHQRLFAWADQGALLWAVAALGLERIISRESDWNFPMLDPIELVRQALADRRPLRELLLESHPSVRITHWLGEYKLAGLLEQEIERAVMGFD
jgi:hypothetical protein